MSDIISKIEDVQNKLIKKHASLVYVGGQLTIKDIDDLLTEVKKELKSLYILKELI